MKSVTRHRIDWRGGALPGLCALVAAAPEGAATTIAMSWAAAHELRDACWASAAGFEMWRWGKDPGVPGSVAAFLGLPVVVVA